MTERPPCPRCGKQPSDFTKNPGPCCNEACLGEWGTGCYHCHHPRFFNAQACKECGAATRMTDAPPSEPWCPKCNRVVAVIGDHVHHPAHYGGADSPYEAIKVIEAWNLGFCLGNAVKYIARHAMKGKPLEDLKKARWYIDHEIKRMEVDDT